MIDRYFYFRKLGFTKEEARELAEVPDDFVLHPPDYVEPAKIEPYLRDCVGYQYGAKRAMKEIAINFSPFIAQCVGEALDFKRGPLSCQFNAERYRDVYERKIREEY